MHCINPCYLRSAVVLWVHFHRIKKRNKKGTTKSIILPFIRHPRHLPTLSISNGCSQNPFEFMGLIFPFNGFSSLFQFPIRSQCEETAPVSGPSPPFGAPLHQKGFSFCLPRDRWEKEFGKLQAGWSGFISLLIFFRFLQSSAVV